MGYTTDFSGSLCFNKPVAPWLMDYINHFSDSRRMKRDVEMIKDLYPNWGSMCFNGDLGEEGQYFIANIGEFVSSRDQDVIDYNKPPAGQPGLWCQWIINNNGELEWDGGEKFYNYEEWLDYLIDNFFEPLGYVLNGDIEWQGEESDDFGIIHVVDNMVDMQYGIKITSMSALATEDLVAELKSRGFDVTPLAV
jgi:hypothetical protein